ncbi:MAG: ABC transporter permease [Rhodoluna sp.]|nr:ABC transporter permease [Rhodoluna sp.]
MAKVVVTPGMFSEREYQASWKTPIVTALFSVLVMVAFGFMGKTENVTYEVSQKADVFFIPNLIAPSNTLAIWLGVLMLLVSATSAWLTISKRKTPVWLVLVFGLLGVVALLAWLAAGHIVPVSFILGQAIALAVPIILGALGGVMSERVGVVNIAIEGQLLTGAFMASVVGTLTHNLWIGMLVAMLTAALLSMALASLAVKYLVDQIIIGVLINALVVGVTNFLFSEWLAPNGQETNYPGTFPIIKIPFLSEIPFIGPALFQTRITVYLTFVLVPLVWFLLFRTKLGLRARSVGEHPMAADTVGINVAKTRFWWVTAGGAIAGLGGAALTIGNVGAFGREMSGGLGFIALAVVILGRWQPFYVSASALLFGFAIILRIWANQVSPGIPTDFIAMIPYLVTLVAVAGFAGKVRAPAASGQPYIKG